MYYIRSLTQQILFLRVHLDMSEVNCKGFFADLLSNFEFVK